MMKHAITLTTQELLHMISQQTGVASNDITSVTIDHIKITNLVDKITQPEDDPVSTNWYPDDSGEWIEYDGNNKPHACAEVYWLTRQERDNMKYYISTQQADALYWNIIGNDGDIVAYKYWDQNKETDGA